MPNIADAFPSKFLKASDLKGAEPAVTMDHVVFEPVGQDKEMKAVLYFRNKEKGLVLNKTNANKITQLTGTGITEEWKGKQIRLYPTETQFGGDMVDCIRIKAVNGRPAPSLPKPIEPPPAPVSDRFIDDDELTDDQIPF